MNQDTFTQPPAPQQPITPPEPQPQSQPQRPLEPALPPQSQPTPEHSTAPQPTPVAEREPASVYPNYVAGTPLKFPAAPAAAPSSAVAPAPSQYKALAIWTLVVNIIYYCLPLLIVLFFSIVYFAGMSNAGSNSNGYVSMLLMSFVLLLAIGTLTLLAGIAAFILDIVYLVKAKPTGAKKVLVIISLSLFGLTIIGALLQGSLAAIL